MLTFDEYDTLFEKSIDLILETGKVSASLIQRRLQIGYARAARLLDELEEAGVIGPARGALPRKILIKNKSELDMASILEAAKKKRLRENMEEAKNLIYRLVRIGLIAVGLYLLAGFIGIEITLLLVAAVLINDLGERFW